MFLNRDPKDIWVNWFIKHIKKNVDKDNPEDIIFFDVLKAFEKFPHQNTCVNFHGSYYRLNHGVHNRNERVNEERLQRVPIWAGAI